MPHLCNAERVQKLVEGGEPLLVAPDGGRIHGHQAISLGSHGQDLFVEYIRGGSHSTQADERGNGFRSGIKVSPPVLAEEQEREGETEIGI